MLTFKLQNTEKHYVRTPQPHPLDLLTDVCSSKETTKYRHWHDKKQPLSSGFVVGLFSLYCLFESTPKLFNVRYRHRSSTPISSKTKSKECHRQSLWTSRRKSKCHSSSTAIWPGMLRVEMQFKRKAGRALSLLLAVNICGRYNQLLITCHNFTWIWIGVAKCGTTALCDKLVQHPDVRFYRNKETDIFTKMRFSVTELERRVDTDIYNIGSIDGQSVNDSIILQQLEQQRKRMVRSKRTFSTRSLSCNCCIRSLITTFPENFKSSSSHRQRLARL